MPDCDPKCSELGIPKHLHQNHRKPDPSFEDHEKIFIRFEDKPDSYLADGSISESIFKTTKQSCNREKYSNCPQDVLYSANSGQHYFDNKIVELVIGDLRGESVTHPNETEITYHFTVLHEPIQCMYPHSEIRFLSSGKLVNKVKPALKLLIKNRLKKLANLSPSHP